MSSTQLEEIKDQYDLLVFFLKLIEMWDQILFTNRNLSESCQIVMIPTCSFYILVQTTFPFHILCMSGTSSTWWKTCK